jgi:uncharacterized membrane protein required for colicin V production
VIVDIIGFIKSAPLVDIGIAAVLFAAVILGILQGAIRGLLGIVLIFLSFLIAANLRDPTGDFLADNWKQFPHDYNRMMAFGIIFVVLALGSILVIQAFYHRTEIYPQRPIVDDILGGLLGLVEGFLLLLVVVVIFGSYKMPPPFTGDIEQIRQVHDLVMNQSHITAALQSNVAPPFLHVLSALLPSDLVSMFP